MVTMFFWLFIGQALRSGLLHAQEVSEHFTYCHVLFSLGKQTPSQTIAQDGDGGGERALGSIPGKGRDRVGLGRGQAAPWGTLGLGGSFADA